MRSGSIMFKTWRGAHHHSHGGGGYIRGVTWSSCMWYSLPPEPHPTVGRRLNVIAPPPLPTHSSQLCKRPYTKRIIDYGLLYGEYTTGEHSSVASHRWFHIVVIWTIDSKIRKLNIYISWHLKIAPIRTSRITCLWIRVPTNYMPLCPSIMSQTSDGLPAVISTPTCIPSGWTVVTRSLEQWLNLFYSPTPRCNLSLTLYTQNCWRIIQVTHSL
jgi:hypothetical protein